MELAVYDYNKLESDELIGSTTVDLENRIFSNEWKAMEFKPIEYRTLWNKTSSNPQGQLKLWIDILTPEQVSTILCVISAGSKESSRKHCTSSSHSI